MTRSRRFALALSLFAATTLGAGTASAFGFCCRPTRVVRLTPTAEGLAQGFIVGTAEIDECSGMSFLRVVALGRVPDGTIVIPALPGLQPVLGNWFTMTSNHGESIAPDITASQVNGRQIDVSDQNFTPVLSGQF